MTTTTETPPIAVSALPTSTVILRAPTTANGVSSFTPPSIPWISGTWHVTHSTLPMWKKARNVAITYKQLASDGTLLDDLVTYQGLSGDKLKTISGVDTPAGPGAWDWRGNGWLKIASSHWEVLGYGGDEGLEQWVVTYFAKTLFTPAGIDIYSRKKEGLSEKTLKDIREALKSVDAPDVKILEATIFEVKID